MNYHDAEGETVNVHVSTREERKEEIAEAIYQDHAIICKGEQAMQVLEKHYGKDVTEKFAELFEEGIGSIPKNVWDEMAEAENRARFTSEGIVREAVAEGLVPDIFEEKGISVQSNTVEELTEKIKNGELHLVEDAYRKLERAEPLDPEKETPVNVIISRIEKGSESDNIIQAEKTAVKYVAEILGYDDGRYLPDEEMNQILESVKAATAETGRTDREFIEKTVNETTLLGDLCEKVGQYTGGYTL